MRQRQVGLATSSQRPGAACHERVVRPLCRLLLTFVRQTTGELSDRLVAVSLRPAHGGDGPHPLQYRHPQTDFGRPKQVGCPVSISTHVVAFTDLNSAVAQDGIGGGHVEEKLRQAVVQ